MHVMDWLRYSVCPFVQGVVAFFQCYEAWWIIWRIMLIGPIRNETAGKDGSNSDWSLFWRPLKYLPMGMDMPSPG